MSALRKSSYAERLDRLFRSSPRTTRLRPDDSGAAESPPADAAPLGTPGPPFDFHISPNISTSRVGTAIILSLFAVPNVILAVLLASKAFWPAAIFIGLGFLGLFAGLTCSRMSLRRSERIFLHDGSIVVERTKASGACVRTRLPAYGLRIESVVDPDFGHLSLALRQRARRVEIARDLSPAERSKFQTAFIDAMKAAGHPIALVTLPFAPPFSPEQVR